MKRCPGVPLDSVICTLPAAEKQKVLQELREYLDQLRALEPHGLVGRRSVQPTTGSLEDFRLSRGGEPCGPFENVVEFHKASRDGVEYPTGNAELDNLILAQESRDYSIKFRHGDLAWRHIFYADGKITGIIDWEFAGWLPDYWEYVMCWDEFWHCPSLRDDIPVFLDPFPEELKMEQARRSIFTRI